MGTTEHKGGPEASDPGASGGLDGLVILVAEDEAIIAMDLEWTLEEAGAERVQLAVSNAEAQGFLVAEPPDAVLLDLNLADGEAEATAAKARELGIPLVFHSGHGARDQLEARFPGVCVLSKPSPAQSIVEALARVVGQTEAHAGAHVKMQVAPATA